MNYLQLVFDDKVLTCNVWPELRRDGSKQTLGDLGYERALRLLIASTVEAVRAEPGCVVIGIGDNALVISQRDAIPAVPEIIELFDVRSQLTTVWRADDEPFGSL
jgi:hypothetical protein